jgi:hypothetical protein
MATNISNKGSKLNSTLLRQQLTFFEQVLTPALNKLVLAINNIDRSQLLLPTTLELILQSLRTSENNTVPHENLLPTLELILQSLRTKECDEDLAVVFPELYRLRICEVTGIGEIPFGAISASIFNAGDRFGFVADIDEMDVVRMVPLPPRTSVNVGPVSRLMAIPYDATGTRFLVNYTQQINSDYCLLKVEEDTMLIDENGNYLAIF